MRTIFSFLFLLLFSSLQAQTDTTYAEKLGYPKGARVLILHVDDAGMSVESNEGVIEATSKGVANSCSVMMPCSWVPGFVHYLKQNPTLDAGLHLTLTSEWKNYRWAPLAGKAAVPGLVDPEGDLWPSVEDVVAHASANEVEKEIRAQIDRAKTMGFTPTHFDSHMGTLFASPAFLQVYVKLGIEFNTPVMLPGGHNTLIQEQMHASAMLMNQLKGIGKMLWQAGLPVLDDLHNTSYDWKIPAEIAADDKKLRDFKTKKYIEGVQSLKPGVTMMIMHCTATDAVFDKISDSGPVRKGDLLTMLDPLFKKALQDQGIVLTTWRELKERRDRIK